VNDFERLVEPHRTSLRLHCYRMLGSSHDGDDMVQETLIRAFRARHTLKDDAAAGGWLHRIATNVCLDELGKRPRRVRGPEAGPPQDPSTPPTEPTPDEGWIEPIPSAWLGLGGGAPDPATAYTLKESVALAFVAALQVLTPSQRAVLLLRDVVGLSAEETAEAMQMSLAAANSALHRARLALEMRVGPRRSEPQNQAEIDRELLERYIRAWQSGNLDAIVALLHDDVILAMPPRETWFAGKSDVAAFFASKVVALRDDLWVYVPLEANGGPAMGLYKKQPEGVAVFTAVHAIEARDGRVAAIDHFLTASSRVAFFAAGTTRAL